MMDNLIKYLTNPITAKILIELEETREITAKQLAVKCPDIPRATLYRSLNRMHSDNILQVVGENKVRGTLEKVYSLNSGFSTNVNDALFDKDGNRVKNFNEEYLKFFIQFAKGLIKEFKDFTDAPNNQDSDCGGFVILTAEASNRQMQLFFKEISDRIQQLKNESCQEKKHTRNVALIFTPLNEK